MNIPRSHLDISMPHRGQGFKAASVGHRASQRRPKAALQIIQRSGVPGKALLMIMTHDSLMGFLIATDPARSGVRGPRPLGPDEIPVGGFLRPAQDVERGFWGGLAPADLEAYRQALTDLYLPPG